MKNLLIAFSFLTTLLILNPLLANAQNSTNNTGGLSPESVGQANSNSSSFLVNSTISASNNTGGLSPESVNQANSNATTALLNTTDSSNLPGGLSSESVTQSQY